MAFDKFAFPLSARIERFDKLSNSFKIAYKKIPCDLQSTPRSYNGFFLIPMEVFFALRKLSFPENYDIRSGDRAFISGFKSPSSTRMTQSYVIKDSYDFVSGMGMSYLETRAGHNTLLDSNFTEPVYRITKEGTQNYNSILEEHYGEDIETLEQFDLNVIQALSLSKYAGETDHGLLEDIEYVAIIDIRDAKFIVNPVKVDDIFRYNDEDYTVKYVYRMPEPVGIAMLGLRSIKNETI